MQVYPNKLSDKLNKQLAAVYLVFGDEPYQKYQSIDAIRNRAKAMGFAERTTLVADKDFEWQQLIEATQSMSLFSAQQLIELELPSGKPGKEGSKQLIHCIENITDDTLLLIHGPRVGKDVQNTKWFKTANKKGPYIPCFALEGQALTRWLRDLAAAKSCQLDHDALALLSEYSEGNMLAGAQEIDKLVLNFGSQRIAVNDVENLVVNQSRYNVFQLVDAILEGNSKKSTKLLQALENEGLEPPIILWSLVREWQTLTELKSTSGAINWNSYRIWGSRQQLYQAALKRLSLDTLSHIGKVLTEADSVFKNQVITRPYVSLCHLCLLFIHPSVHELEWSA